MSVYEDFRHRVHGPTVPLPVLYKDDLSINYSGIGHYVSWVLDKGIRNLCLTYGYSQIATVTTGELLEINRTIARIVGDRALFISCTRGDSVEETIETVHKMQQDGAHSAFVMPSMMWLAGDEFRNFIFEVASATDLPVMFVSSAAPNAANTPSLSSEGFARLLELENVVGLKEDFNTVPYRTELVRRYGDRIAIIGGGIQRNYLFFHRYPCQGELDGMFSPSRALRFVKTLDEDRLSDALQMIDDYDRVVAAAPTGLHWLAKNQVVMHILGFAESWRMRPPVDPATEEQARAIESWVRKHPDVFEL